MKYLYLLKRIGMEHIKFKQVSIEDIYTSIIKATRVIDDRGWTGIQPVASKRIDTGNEFMDAIGKLLAENCHIRTYELAQSIGVSKAVLNGMLMLFTGMMTEELLLAYRLMRVKEWLAYTGVSIDEAAARSGFTSQSILGRVFQRKLKTTPAKYRNTHRPENFRELYQWEE